TVTFIIKQALIVPLLIFLFDWNPVTANMRPDSIPADEGKYITDNEFTIIICTGWAVLLIIPVLITSYLTRQWIGLNSKLRSNTPGISLHTDSVTLQIFQ
ncbi:hypothetical protein, partial [Muribaculum intestinale]|uniref:hypothetical protein n=3 Tax=Muribaculum intestinale TaxID=1796646 RepID=UPI003EBB5777